MDTPLCSLCVVYFQRALNSPVGEAVSSFIRLFDPPLNDEYNILSIFEKLRKNLYSKPEEWLSDLDKNVEQSLRFFGVDSEISIAIQSIQHNLHESTKHLLKGNNENWLNSRQKFLSSLDTFLSSLPNNEVSFRDFVEQSSPAVIPNQKPFIPSPLTLQNEKIDFNELKALYQNLPTDEDYQYLSDVISRYEPEYAKASGIVPCDLRNLNQLTLHLMMAYAKKHALPLPRPLQSATALSNLTDLISNSSLTPQKLINPASIPRMKSTPLPPSPKDTKRPPPLVTDTKSSILSNSSFAHPLSAKPTNSSSTSSSTASQNLHSSLQVAATNQVLAKTLSQAASQIHNSNNKNNNKQVSAVAAFSALSAALESALANSNSQNSSFSNRNTSTPVSIPPSSLKSANSTIASTSPFLKMNSPTPSAGDSDENGQVFDSISPSSSRSEGFDHDNDNDDENHNQNEK